MSPVAKPCSHPPKFAVANAPCPLLGCPSEPISTNGADAAVVSVGGLATRTAATMPAVTIPPIIPRANFPITGPFPQGCPHR